jgi:hypothetical protein
MTLKELHEAVRIATDGEFKLSDEAIQTYIREGLVELHETPVVDVDCSCDLCRFVTR